MSGRSFRVRNRELFSLLYRTFDSQAAFEKWALRTLREQRNSAVAATHAIAPPHATDESGSVPFVRFHEVGPCGCKSAMDRIEDTNLELVWDDIPDDESRVRIPPSE